MGVRVGTLLDPDLVAKLRVVAARTDIAHRVLTILEPAEAQQILRQQRQVQLVGRGRLELDLGKIGRAGPMPRTMRSTQPRSDCRPR